MSKKKRRIFESDRRIELKVRMAVKKMREQRHTRVPASIELSPLEREIVHRLIDKVRKL
jgi:hypothetical protein